MRLTMAMTAARLPSGRGNVLEIQVSTTMKQHCAPMAIRNMAKKRGPRWLMVTIMMLPAIVTHMGMAMCQARSLNRDAEKALTRLAMKVATQIGQVRSRAGADSIISICSPTGGGLEEQLTCIVIVPKSVDNAREEERDGLGEQHAVLHDHEHPGAIVGHS